MQDEGGEPSGRRNWMNIYRTDDYIGTHISIDQMIVGPAKIGRPVNVEVGLGAHTGYFKDKRVIPRIHAFVEEKI